MGKCFALALLISVVCLAVQAPPLEVYYWRTFKGEIPKDALSIGLDNMGNSIYIGEVQIEDTLFSGKIFDGDDNLYYDDGVENLSVNEGVRILCTQTPEIFEWVPNSSHKHLELSDNILVKSYYGIMGFPSVLIGIGRKQTKEETHIGKVYCSETWCGALYTALNWKRTVYFDNFEILTYNPNNLKNLTMT